MIFAIWLATAGSRSTPSPLRERFQASRPEVYRGQDAARGGAHRLILIPQQRYQSPEERRILAETLHLEAEGVPDRIGGVEAVGGIRRFVGRQVEQRIWAAG
jgi:hypothetical protein